MAGLFRTQLLANGQLATLESDLYLVPATASAIVVTVVLVNTDTVSRSVDLVVKRSGGTSRRIIPKGTVLATGYSLETDREYTLGSGDAIRGSATAGTIVDFSVHGIEEI